MSNEYNNTEVSKRIKQLLASAGETEYGLAKGILKITPSAVSQAMRNSNNWSTISLIEISRYFEVSLDWLVWGKEFNETEQFAKLREENLTIKIENEKLRAENKIFNKIKEDFQAYLGKKAGEG